MKEKPNKQPKQASVGEEASWKLGEAWRRTVCVRSKRRTAQAAEGVSTQLFLGGLPSLFRLYQSRLTIFCMDSPNS